MSAYYNENDPAIARWLRELIARGLIAEGEVDERSIEDVTPNDLLGFTQCHFFAGIGGWSYALRIAGWPDDRPVWTGSCPCQPFSSAGSRRGLADERHLWPSWWWLVQGCRPVILFGEQTASSLSGEWLDHVCDDMEALGYACAAVVSPAASVGAPHRRERLYWVAHAGQGGRERARVSARPSRLQDSDIGGGGEVGGVADAERAGLEGHAGNDRRTQGRARPRGPVGAGGVSGVSGVSGGVADAASAGRRTGLRAPVPEQSGGGEPGNIGSDDGPRPCNGRWAHCDWLGLRDGSFRPVEPGTFPLAYGLPARVVRMRGYGNAIVPDHAAAFIRAAMEEMDRAGQGIQDVEDITGSTT